MSPAGQTIGVDRIRCDGRGVCAELLPERIRLDDWGYPIIDPAPIGRDLAGHARRAVRSCPRLALRLEAAGTARRQAAGGSHGGVASSGRVQTSRGRAGAAGVQE